MLVPPDGTRLADLTSNERAYETDTRFYSWSPDASRIAFSSHRDGPAREEIYVMNPDGSGQRRLTDSGRDSLFNFEPVWSPDGKTIAYVQDANLSDSLWLMNADGSNQRQLANVGAIVRRLQWSPDSTRLLYQVDNAPPTRVEIVDTRSGVRRSITPAGRTDFYPVWSPDGRSIAVTSNPFASTSQIDVVDAANGTRRAVSSAQATEPAWSPDGTKLAFIGIRTFPQYATRYGPPQRLDVYVVDADGRGERRLTGPLDDDELDHALSGFEPTWWPDGSRIFFNSGDGIGAGATTYVMNADGSCEQRFGPAQEPRLLYPAWRPGSIAVPPTASCADLQLGGDAPRDPAGLNQAVRLQLRLDNDGDLTATGIRLEITASPAARVEVDPSLACTGSNPVACELPSLPAQQGRTINVDVSSAHAGVLQTHFVVTANERDQNLLQNQLTLAEPVLPCLTIGTTSADNLRGTPGRDSICGRGGADRIDARGGKDFVDAGAGDDTIIGGAGRDRIDAGVGNDVVLVRDGQRDTVTCGSDRDVVIADRLDRVAADCERIYRR